MVGFTGSKANKDIAADHAKTCDDFCKIMDESLPENHGKKILPKYKLYIPLANWVKFAAEATALQSEMKEKSIELNEMHTTRPILNAELAQLETKCEELSAQIKEANASGSQITQFVSLVSFIAR